MLVELVLMDEVAGAITTASGFDDFIRDLPDLVSQAMIDAYQGKVEWYY